MGNEKSAQSSLHIQGYIYVGLDGGRKTWVPNKDYFHLFSTNISKHSQSCLWKQTWQVLVNITWALLQIAKPSLLAEEYSHANSPI